MQHSFTFNVPMIHTYHCCEILWINVILYIFTKVTLYIMHKYSNPKNISHKDIVFRQII